MPLSLINNGDSGLSVRTKLNAGLTQQNNAAGNWVELTDVGVDCTGATDATTALQAAINASPNYTTFVIPAGAVIKLSKPGIVMTDATQTEFTSFQRPENFGVSPIFQWNDNGGTMFTLNHCDHPTFRGLAFVPAAGATIDGFMVFDGNPGSHIGTDALIEYCSFDSGAQCNPNFIAVSISPTATDNHENYRIENCDIACSVGSSRAVVRSTAGSISSASNIVTATGANFQASEGPASFTGSGSGYVLTVSGLTGTINLGCTITGTGVPAVTYIIRQLTGSAGGTGTYVTSQTTTASGTINATGRRIRVSYKVTTWTGTGIFDTTISSVDSTTQVHTAGNAPSTQSNCTVHVGEGFGVGIKLGASANAKHLKIINVRYLFAAIGIYTLSGSCELVHPAGGYSDVGLWLAAGLETIFVRNFDSESDLQGILVTGSTAVILEGVRGSLGNSRADGWISVAPGGTQLNLIMIGYSESDPPPNTTNRGIFNLNTGAVSKLVSIGNWWRESFAVVNMTTQFGYVTAFGDAFAGSSDTQTIFLNMPTSSAGLPTGTVYNNSGVLTVV